MCLNEIKPAPINYINALICVKYKQYQKDLAYQTRITQGVELFAQINTQNNCGFDQTWLDVCDNIDGREKEKVLTAQETIDMFEKLKGGI